MPAGRPIEWTEEKKIEVVDFVCSEMTEGKSVKKIFDEKLIPLPARKEFYAWLIDSKELCNKYSRAGVIRSDYLADEALDISDNCTHDAIYTEKGEIANHEYINRSRLRVDTRKWMVSVLNPTKYGNKTDITTNGKEIGTPLSQMTPEQIKFELERLKTK